MGNHIGLPLEQGRGRLYTPRRCDPTLWIMNPALRKGQDKLCQRLHLLFCLGSCVVVEPGAERRRYSVWWQILKGKASVQMPKHMAELSRSPLRSVGLLSGCHWPLDPSMSAER